MRKTLFLAVHALLLFCWSFASAYAAGPLWVLDSATADLNADGSPDVILLLQDEDGTRVVSLLAQDDGYGAGPAMRVAPDSAYLGILFAEPGSESRYAVHDDDQTVPRGVVMVLLPQASAKGPASFGLTVGGSCCADLDADGREDAALLFSSGRGGQVVALLRRSERYDPHMLMQDIAEGPNVFLFCRQGESVQETRAAGGGRVLPVPAGRFLELDFHEGSRVAWVWNGAAFEEVWTAD
jgi:hypothetical protein